MSYSELLRDPRWNERRVEILKRDEFTCRECEIKDVTLQVHHHFYHRDTMPWDYDDEILITLCEPCHLEEELLKDFDLMNIQYLLTLGLTRQKISRLISAISKRFNRSNLDINTQFRNLIARIDE
jgi:hypothetical protein